MAMVWDLQMKSHTEKLVLLALADHSDIDGYCWPSIKYLADKCSLSSRAVIDQLNSLEKDGVISRVEKGNSSKSTRYRLNFGPNNEEFYGGSEQGSLVNGVQGGSEQGSLGVVNGVHLGSEQRSHQPSVNRHIEPSMNREVIEIYEAYPLKVGKPDALKAIGKAIKKHGSEYVLGRTKLYAASRVGQDPKFTPHPSTFYNQERYNDDPETWKARIQLQAPKEISVLGRQIARAIKEAE